jgi:hypothetical protein
MDTDTYESSCVNTSDCSDSSSVGCCRDECVGSGGRDRQRHTQKERER